MRKTAWIIFCLVTLLSCKQESKFNLDKDIGQFSEKMENGDTLEVNVNLSACMMSAFERYNFTKKNDTLYLETYSEIKLFEKQQQTLPKTVYAINPADSISFENFLKYLEKENKPKREYGSFLVNVYYPNKHQSKYFYDDGLNDKFKKLDKLSLIRKKIYPNDHFFESPEPPPPPPVK